MSPARAAVVATGLSVALYLGSVAVVSMARRSLSELPVLAEVPELGLIQRGGQEVARGQLLGRLQVVGLLATPCESPCAEVLARMRELHGAFAGSDAVGLISLVADEQAASGARLEALASQHGIPESGWLLLAGEPAAVADLVARLFGCGSPTAAGSGRKLVLLDRDGRVRGRYDARDETSARMLKSQVRELVRAGGGR